MRIQTAKLTVAGLALALACLQGGCAGSGDASMAAARNVPPLDSADYRLGPGDKVRVTVFGEPSLSGEFEVAGNGKVSLPLIGQVQAAGASTKDFQDTVQRTLSDGFLKQPRVSVGVINYRPYYILGEVQRPGQYPYTSGLTVLNAVATAGGFTYRATQNRVRIKHANAPKEVKLRLKPNTPVEPGDTIRIGERLF